MKKAILGVGCVLRSEGLCWKVSMDEANDGHIIIVIIIISIITIIIIIISSSILVESVDDDHRSEGHSGGLLAQRAIWGILDIFLWKTQEDIHDICSAGIYPPVFSTRIYLCSFFDRNIFRAFVVKCPGYLPVENTTNVLDRQLIFCILDLSSKS